MSNFKKNIILSSVNKQNKDIKGVFTIEHNNNVCTGILRIYNLNANGNYCLGVLVDGIPLQKTTLNCEVVFCKVELPNTICLNSNIAVVVVENCGTTNNPIVFGTTQNCGYSDAFNFFKTQNLSQQIESEIKKQIPELQEVVNQTATQEQISMGVLNQTSTAPQNKCDNCVYKQHFYSQSNCACQQQENRFEQEEVKSCEQEVCAEKNNKSFFEIVSPKLDELFEQYSPCEQLNNLISSSRWVTVIVSETEKYYIGIIYENSNPKFIAYAVDGVYSKTPPKQLEPDAQWLPCNSMFPESEGYWLMFQDAITGE